MAKVGIPLLFLFSMFFLALPDDQQHITQGKMSSPRPLCSSQFALVNYACARVPRVPLPPPTHPHQESGHGNEHRHGHKHGHRHRHRHRHRHHETPEQNNCCRWLKTVDIECICDILVNLPAFLSRPNHQFTVDLDENRSVTYSCGGRLKP
ncbi:hypothetical protein DITRI_Ditri13aG0088200 [Diplodiscus trichospermus]